MRAFVQVRKARNGPIRDAAKSISLELTVREVCKFCSVFDRTIRVAENVIFWLIYLQNIVLYVSVLGFLTGD